MHFKGHLKIVNPVYYISVYIYRRREIQKFAAVIFLNIYTVKIERCFWFQSLQWSLGQCLFSHAGQAAGLKLTCGKKNKLYFSLTLINIYFDNFSSDVHLHLSSDVQLRVSEEKIKLVVLYELNNYCKINVNLLFLRICYVYVTSW